MIDDIKTQVSDNFKTEVNRNKQIKIMLESAESYRKLTKFYLENNIEYYTFQPKSDRPLSVVLKMVPESLSDGEIKVELENLGLHVISVTRLLLKKRTDNHMCSTAYSWRFCKRHFQNTIFVQLTYLR